MSQRARKRAMAAIRAVRNSPIPKARDVRHATLGASAISKAKDVSPTHSAHVPIGKGNKLRTNVKVIRGKVVPKSLSRWGVK